MAMLLIPAGCSSSKPPLDPYKERKFFGVAMRQLPPEPVYNRLRLAHLPSPLPVKFREIRSDSVIMPVFHYQVKQATLEEAARVLANTSRYTSYCSSVIADRKMDIETLGTIDEIGEFIGKKAGIKVVVDHANKEVRFLANAAVEPALTEPALSAVQQDQAVLNSTKVEEPRNEHKSLN